ncbi:hypothetical protein K439DRAFT_1624018 [Ramaria rubella]|nr:hypothetical protein K439DRAFT_1624018 [Ramaria rubella]
MSRPDTLNVHMTVYSHGVNIKVCTQHPFRVFDTSYNRIVVFITVHWTDSPKTDHNDTEPIVRITDRLDTDAEFFSPSFGARHRIRSRSTPNLVDRSIVENRPIDRTRCRSASVSTSLRNDTDEVGDGNHVVCGCRHRHVVTCGGGGGGGDSNPVGVTSGLLPRYDVRCHRRGSQHPRQCCHHCVGVVFSSEGHTNTVVVVVVSVTVVTDVRLRR